MRTEKKFESKDKKGLKKDAEEYAQREGFKLNPDEKIVDGISNGLLRNKKKHGELYCPCRVVTGDKKEDEKIICPCIYHKDEIKKDRHCKCLLFWKR